MRVTAQNEEEDRQNIARKLNFNVNTSDKRRFRYEKKSVIGIFCMVLLAGLLAGCGSKNVVVSNQDENQVKFNLTFFGNKNEPENVTVIEEIITGFMDENPDTRLSYESLKGTDYF